MTPQEKVMEIACNNCCCSFEDKSKANCRHYNNVWQMHEWDKQRFIEWATEWLKHNIYDYFYWIEMEGESEANIKDTLFDNFKKTMEDEL